MKWDKSMKKGFSNSLFCTEMAEIIIKQPLGQL